MGSKKLSVSFPLKFCKAGCLLALLFFFGGHSLGRPGMELLRQARGLVLPLYDPSDKLLGVFRVELAEKGLQRKGFFQIGLLPELHIKTAVFEIRSESDGMAAFRALSQRLQDLGGPKRIEFDGFKLVIGPAAGGQTVAAQKAVWNLEESTLAFSRVKLSGNGLLREANEAHFCLQGRAAGCLVFRESLSSVSIPLFPRPQRL